MARNSIKSGSKPSKKKSKKASRREKTKSIKKRICESGSKSQSNYSNSQQKKQDKSVPKNIKRPQDGPAQKQKKKKYQQNFKMNYFEAQTSAAFTVFADPTNKNYTQRFHKPLQQLIYKTSSVIENESYIQTLKTKMFQFIATNSDKYSKPNFNLDRIKKTFFKIGNLMIKDNYPKYKQLLKEGINLEKEWIDNYVPCTLKYGIRELKKNSNCRSIRQSQNQKLGQDQGLGHQKQENRRSAQITQIQLKCLCCLYLLLMGVRPVYLQEYEVSAAAFTIAMTPQSVSPQPQIIAYQQPMYENQFLQSSEPLAAQSQSSSQEILLVQIEQSESIKQQKGEHYVDNMLNILQGKKQQSIGNIRNVRNVRNDNQKEEKQQNVQQADDGSIEKDKCQDKQIHDKDQHNYVGKAANEPQSHQKPNSFNRQQQASSQCEYIGNRKLSALIQSSKVFNMRSLQHLIQNWDYIINLIREVQSYQNEQIESINQNQQMQNSAKDINSNHNEKNYQKNQKQVNQNLRWAEYYENQCFRNVLEQNFDYSVYDQNDQNDIYNFPIKERPEMNQDANNNYQNDKSNNYEIDDNDIDKHFLKKQENRQFNAEECQQSGQQVEKVEQSKNNDDLQIKRSQNQNDPQSKRKLRKRKIIKKIAQKKQKNIKKAQHQQEYQHEQVQGQNDNSSLFQVENESMNDNENDNHEDDSSYQRKAVKKRKRNPKNKQCNEMDVLVESLLAYKKYPANCLANYIWHTLRIERVRLAGQ